MNVLIIGNGNGSFAIRGHQLGKAIGARVVTVPSDDDLRWADVVVLIKRALMSWAEYVHRFGKPIVWDALDFWEQERDRNQNGLSETGAKALLAEKIARYRPRLVIGATEAMARDAGGVYLPHHSRPGLTPAPARDVVTTVGYEGTKKFLGRWAKAIQQECDRRGWKFVINPADLRQCDILVAFRDGIWDGWMCREWKSGVKLVNAMAAGRPIITQDSAAWRETIPMAEMHDIAIDDTSDLSVAFDFWPLEMRMLCAVNGPAFAEDYALPVIASRYRQILQGVLKAKAA